MTTAEKNPEPAAEAGILAGGTRWETPFYLVDSGRDGPTVALVSGVHGDEVAGPLALEGMLAWELERGRLWLVPRASQPALGRGTRHAPRSRFPDLNRNFPRAEGDEPRGTIAGALWQAIQATQPDWVLDLHEGFDFNRVNKRSVGSSVLCLSTDDSRRQAERLVRAVNATVAAPAHHFTLLGRSARGSLCRAVFDQLGIPAMILETTKKKQPLEVRVRQHQLMVRELLTDLAMLARSA